MKNKPIKGGIKAAFLLLLVVLAFFLFRHTPLREYLAPQALQEMVDNMGVASPLIFIGVYGIGITMFLPATMFTGIGALLFGASWGFFYNITGAMLGASLRFFGSAGIWGGIMQHR